MNDEEALEKFANFTVEIFLLYGVLGYIAVKEGLKKMEENSAKQAEYDELKLTVKTLTTEVACLKEELIKIKTQN